MATKLDVSRLHLEKLSIDQLEKVHAKFTMLKVHASKDDKATLDQVCRACEDQAGNLIRAAANVEDKVEHSWPFDAMVHQFAAIAGCTEDALLRTIWARQTFVD